MAFVSRCEIYITTTGTAKSHLVHKETCEIVYDSILQNKEKTKNYWEQLMLAAELASEASCKLAAGAGTVPGAGRIEREESVVEREIRIQREREREHALAHGHAQTQEDTLSSIPTTDEGNYSEYGSEEKEHSLDGNTSRVMSPEGGFSHERTPSYESMSSGHSSTLGEAHTPTAVPQRKETPIEREIRLAKEREEELRREKRNSLNIITSDYTKGGGDKATQRNSTRLLSVKRIQKEMMLENENDDTKTVTKDTCFQNKDDSKPEVDSTRLKKCVSMSNLPEQRDCESGDTSGTGPKTPNGVGRPAQGWSQPRAVSTPKLITANKHQKGLMKRFLESHGRMVPTFSLGTPGNAPKSPESVEPRKILIERTQDEKPEANPNVVARRPGYISAEDKIQMELEEMKKREAELRKERARNFGRSQPNLQEIDDEEEEEEDEEEVRLPTMGKLRTALSNPNLIENKPVVQKATPHKRRSALIDAWENRIRNEQ